MVIVLGLSIYKHHVRNNSIIIINVRNIIKNMTLVQQLPKLYIKSFLQKNPHKKFLNFQNVLELQNSKKINITHRKFTRN